MQSAVESVNNLCLALGYWLDDRGSSVRFPAEAGNFSLHHSVQTGSEAHPASYPMGTTGSFPGDKRPGRESDHSPLSSTEVKNARSYTSTPQYVFMACCLVKHRDNFTLLVFWQCANFRVSEKSWKCPVIIYEARYKFIQKTNTHLITFVKVFII
jgi:hypothetical protein